jgi:hypothetical protein
MPFILIILFAFALLVTCAGFFLSFKSRSHTQKATFAPPRARSGQRVMDTRRRVEGISRVGRSGRVVGNRSNPALSISSLGERVGWRQTGEPAPFTLVVIVAVSVFVLGLFAFNFVMPRNAVFNLTWLSNSASSASQPQSTPPASQQKQYRASQNLVRIGQLDPAQYNSSSDYNLWALSACSPAAIAEVINAYGHNYRVADILKVEASINEISPTLGLLEDVGLARTMSKFGFKTAWGYNLSYDQVVATANRGEPVIVGWPPARYKGGHLVVVIGGNSQTVFIADSSIFNRRSLSRAQFMKWWAGYSAVATPL